jgi:uncharacterized Fe-S cluster protein YjdI
MERDGKQFSGGRKYKNDEITVYWKPSACVHASYCYRELIEVFDPGRRPWVDLNGAETKRIIETVNLCPTEALTWKWNNEDKNQPVGIESTNHIKFKRPELMKQNTPENEGRPVSIKIMANGPILIKGNFYLSYKGQTKEVKDGLISICRCGRSDQMPFCDGKHKKIGFIG